MTKHILAIGAHPDDVEFIMAGTLALFKDHGWSVSIGVIAKGDCGSKVMSRSEITNVRRKEAEKAAEILGAQIYFMGQNDLGIDICPEARKIVTEAVRKAAPDVVLTHSPTDYMTDHEYASRLVRDACFACSAPNYETEVIDPAPALDHIPALFYADPTEGTDLWGQDVKPAMIVDVAAKMELKREMLACHASQRDWLRAQHGIDQYLVAMEEWCGKRGRQAGFAFGEGFRQHLGHAYPSNNALREVLGDKVSFV